LDRVKFSTVNWLENPQVVLVVLVKTAPRPTFNHVITPEPGNIHPPPPGAGTTVNTWVLPTPVSVPALLLATKIAPVAAPCGTVAVRALESTTPRWLV
jgi:hypothetical protein